MRPAFFCQKMWQSVGMRRRVVVLIFLAAACSKGAEKPLPSSEQSSPPAFASASADPQQDAASSAGQSFQEGMQAICDSIDAVPPSADPAQHQRKVARWLDINVTNPQVRELFALIGDMPASQRPGMLRAAATKAGLQTCALAER